MTEWKPKFWGVRAKLSLQMDTKSFMDVESHISGYESTNDMGLSQNVVVGDQSVAYSKDGAVKACCPSEKILTRAYGYQYYHKLYK